MSTQPQTYVRDGTVRGWFSVTKAATAAIAGVQDYVEESGTKMNLAITRSIYFELVELANNERCDRAEISHAGLIKAAGGSRGSVATALRYLKRAGVIEVHEKFSARGRAENEYVIVDPPEPSEGAENSTPCSLSEHPAAHPLSSRCSPPEQQPQEVEEEERERDSKRAGASPAVPDNSPVDVLCARFAALREPFDRDATRLAASLAWRQDAQQLLDDRGGKLGELLAILEWLPTDTFWAPKVLQPGDLRRHVVRIAADRDAKLKSARDGPKPVPKTRHGRELAAKRERSAALIAAAGTCCCGDGPPLPAEAEWAALAPKLREAVGDATFGVWLDGHAHAGADGELLLAVSEEIHEWVADRFGPVLARTAGRPIEVVVCQEAITA